MLQEVGYGQRANIHTFSNTYTTSIESRINFLRSETLRQKEESEKFRHELNAVHIKNEDLEKKTIEQADKIEDLRKVPIK